MSNEPKAGKRIGPEMLAAYIDNRLPPEQRAAVEAQLATDPESYALLVDTLEALDDDEIKALEVKEPSRQAIPFAPKAPKQRVRSLLMASGALAAAASIALAVWTRPDVLLPFLQETGQTNEPAPEFHALVAAVGEQRIVEGRFTGGFAFGQMRSERRSTAQDRTDNLALVAAAANLQQAAGSSPTTRNLHRWGVAQVLLGRPEAGVDTLNTALAAEKDNARLLTDLSAAYLELARVQDGEGSWVTALEMAERALVLEPLLHEASFNRALALEGLRLPSARDAWIKYLSIDSASPWAGEARKHLEQLPTGGQSQRRLYEQQLITVTDSADVHRVVKADPQKAREFFEEEFARAVAQQQKGEQGASVLEKARALVAALESASEDRLQRDLLNDITQSSDTVKPTLSSALADFSEAASLVRQDRQAEAEPFLRKAMAGLGASHPLSGWIGYYQAQREAQLGKLDESLRRLSTLLRTASARHYLSLAGTIHGRIGQIHSRRGELEQAIAARQAAILSFRRAGDLDQVAVMERMIAEAYYLLGDFPSLWRHQVRALQLLPSTPNYRSRHMVLLLAGVSASAQGNHLAAVTFHKELLLNAEEWQRASGIAEAHSLLADAHFRSGASAEASTHIAIALSQARSISDPQFRKRIELELLETKGRLLAAERPAEAIEALTDALTRASISGYDVKAASLLRLRASAHRHLGRWADAEYDWAAARARLELERGSLSAQQSRLSQAGALRGLATEVSVARFERGDSHERALEPIEEARARTLVEVAMDGEENRADVGTIQRTIPESVCLVYFLVASDRAIAWVMSRDQLVAVELGASESQIAELLSRYRYAGVVLRDEEKFKSASRLVSRVLIEPIWPYISLAQTLVVVADPALQGLSFGSLLIPDGQFLIQRMAVAKAPSGRLVSLPAKAAKSNRTVLFAAANAPNLKALPWAEDEVRQIASQYEHPEVITDSDATRERFLVSAAGARIIHFAGHAVGSPQSPLLSRLYMNADSSGRSAIYSYELIGTDLPSAIVVLSACQSGYAGSSIDDDGTLAMARPFLARGAQAVVATSWDVSDRSTSLLMRDFHSSLRSGESPINAWRSTAIAAIQNGVETLEWAAYTVIVGRGALLSFDRSTPSGDY